MTSPIWWQWDAKHLCLRPTPRFELLVKNMYVDGQRYRLAEEHDRSAASHDHYFACINSAWDNLPEDIAGDFPSPDHLRKWALCKAGYAAEQAIALSSPEEANRIALFARQIDNYAVIIVRDLSVRVFTAESQALKAMGKARFESSKAAVLDILSELIGTDVTTLKSNAGKSA